LREKLLDYLACPDCGANVQLQNTAAREGAHVMQGELACTSCAKSYPIERGIPRFAQTETIEADKAATAENFGWQWLRFTQEDERYADQFLGWIAPVKKDFFRDKLVLEGGCGKGRHTQLAAQWGTTDVVGIDLSDAVESAFVATRELENAHIVQADIYRLPVRPVFDYAFSVGVLHHLPDPFGGFRSLASKVKPNGYLSAWVYGAENNQWITNFVNPLRERVTSRMGKPALFQLSKVPTALLFAATKLVYGPLNRSTAGSKIASHLFYNEYLKSLAPFGWREHHVIVFDHLVAPTSHYISRADFENWWTAADARDVVIGWHNQNSWRGFGRI
jgi:SAM-dependent methyltransferase